SLGPGSQLAVAARHSPVVYTLDSRNGFPTCAFTQRTNVSGSLNHCDSSSCSHDRVCVAPDALARFFSLSTVHRNAHFAQARIPDDLCTSCAGPPRSVEDLGKSFLPVPEGAPQARTGAKEVRNGLPARIFTVDILARESTIPAVRF